MVNIFTKINEELKVFNKNEPSWWAQWCAHVILETQEAKRGGLRVQGQPQKLCEALGNVARPCLKIKNKESWRL